MLTGEFLRLPAKRSPNHVAIIGNGHRPTYREFDVEANRFAHGLLSLGAEILLFESRYLETIKETRKRLPDLKHEVLLDEPQLNPRIPGLRRL